MTEFLQTPFLGQAAWLWLVFIGIVVTLLAFDLGVLHTSSPSLACAPCISRSPR